MTYNTRPSFAICHKTAYTEQAARRKVTLRNRNGTRARSPHVQLSIYYCAICENWHIKQINGKKDERERAA